MSLGVFMQEFLKEISIGVVCISSFTKEGQIVLQHFLLYLLTLLVCYVKLSKYLSVYLVIRR